MAAAHTRFRPRIWLADRRLMSMSASEGAVGRCRSDKQNAGALAQIAPPSSGGHDILIRAQLG